MKEEVDSSLIISFMPRDIRVELEEGVYQGSASEDAKWWLGRSDEELALIGGYILGNDYIWNVFNEELRQAMRDVRGAIERGEMVTV
jgi:hypothetical protein